MPEDKTRTMIEITVPVLNEEATIAAQIYKVIAYTDKYLTDLGSIGLVIADNGSTDGTQEIARRLEAEFGRVRYIRLEERGVGRALKASWRSSDAEIVGYMDLDLATDLRHLRPALEALQGNRANIVTGSRLAPGAQVKSRKLTRAITSRAFNLFVRAMFSTCFTDGMCGFKFLQRYLFPRLEQGGAVSDDWIFATELLIVGEYLGLKVMDLPVRWTDDPCSKAHIGKLAVEYVAALCTLRRRLARQGLVSCR